MNQSSIRPRRSLDVLHKIREHQATHDELAPHIGRLVLIDPTQKLREKAPIITYSGQEAIIARRGLWNHIGITYLGVKKSSNNEEKGLLAVYQLLDKNIDSFRAESYQSMIILKGLFESVKNGMRMDKALKNQENYGSPIVLSRFRFAYEVHRLGKAHPTNKLKIEQQLVKSLDEVKKANDFEVFELAERAATAHIGRVAFWSKEVNGVYDHPIVEDLLYAIDSSYEPETPLTD